MGTEASFQALPEAWPLLVRARHDRDTAEQIELFHFYAERIANDMPQKHNLTNRDFYAAVETLLIEDPGLLDRYFWAGKRGYDKIVYLLSPERRAESAHVKDSLIYHVIYGSEPLHPEARSGQGYPMGFVPAAYAQTLAAYLKSISFEQLHAHYDPTAMCDAGVYRMHYDDDEAGFEDIWNEFKSIREVYQAASEHNEAIIAVID